MNENNLEFSEINNDNFYSTFEENKIDSKKDQLNTTSVCSLTKNNKKQIFIIKKTRLGNKRNRNSNKKRKTHTKESNDNIISNIKNKILNNLIDFINNKIKKLKNSELMKLSLKNIDKTKIPISNKKNKLRLLNMTLKNIFSENVSERYKKLARNDPNYKYHNKKCINKIYENLERDSDLISLFEKTFKDIIEIYNGKKEKSEYFEGFITLKDDIKNLDLKLKEQKEQKESYINKYKNVAENFVEIIESIKKRNSQK